MSRPVRIGVISFPGTCDDRDALHAVELAGGEADRAQRVAVVAGARERDHADARLPRHSATAASCPSTTTS
ncbi:MAG: hypothetical protein QOK36_3104 [Gaiellales bacterium]|nr:hypothetical protein [Gaiellales bacterium]